MALTTLLPPWTGVGDMLCLEARSPHNQAPFQLPSFCLRPGPHPVSMKYTTDDLVPISGQDAALGECPEGVQGWATVKPLTAGFPGFPRAAAQAHVGAHQWRQGPPPCLERTPGVSSQSFISQRVGAVSRWGQGDRRGERGGSCPGDNGEHSRKAWPQFPRS